MIRQAKRIDVVVAVKINSSCDWTAGQDEVGLLTEVFHS